MKEQSNLDIAWVCKKEWCRKLFVILMAVVLLLCFTTLLSLIIGLILQESFSLPDNIVFGIGILCGSWSGDSAESDLLLYVNSIRLVWLFVSFFMSAFIAHLAARPIGIVAIAPHFVANTDEDVLHSLEEEPGSIGDSGDQGKCYLEFRYWLRLPSGEYAFDVNCVLELSTSRIANRGVNLSTPLLRFEDEYLCARGVRVFRIALDKDQEEILRKEFFPKKETASKEDAAGSAKKIKSKDEPFLRFRITGRRKDGQYFAAYRVFRSADFCNGYRFASIRKTSCLNLDLKDVGGIEYMLSSHFEKLYRCYRGDYSVFPETDAPKGLIAPGRIEPGIYDRFSRVIHYCSYAMRCCRQSFANFLARM